MIKAIIFIISFFIITYRIGLITAKLTKREKIIEIFIFGIITVFAILQIVLLPSIVFHVKFIIPYIISLSIMLILMVASFIIVKPKQEMEKWKIYIGELKRQSKMELALNICIIVAVAFQTISSSYLFRENADDSFYVSLATQSIDSDKLYMEDPSLGLEKEYTLFSSFEQISAYELGVAILAKAFAIKPVVLFHSILPFIFIIFEYMAYYYLINIINKQRKNSKLVLLILSIILLFGGFSSKFRTGCLLYKAWQGKGMFLNFGLTTLWAILLQRNEKKEKELISLIIITNIANVFLSSTAIFIVSFAYIGFGIIDLIRKDWKEIGNLIISFLPIVISVLILLILMKTTHLQTNIEFSKQNLKELILLYGSKKYLLLYLLSFLIIAFTGKKQERIFFIIIPIINVLTIWNPLFINIIAKYLTSSVTFWRVLWLLPIEVTIAYALNLIIQKATKDRCKSLIFICEIIIIMLCGKFTYSKENGFEKPENWEKIPQYIVEQTNYILENSEKDKNIMVMAPGEPLHSCTMRQLTPKIELLYSRIMYFDDLITHEEQEERSELYNIYFYGVPTYSYEEFNKKIEKFNIDWIIIPSEQNDLKKYLKNTIMKEQKEIKGYILYKNER
ncbi:MAG: DUF6077 domain-containing protein [Clostridia bacterium]